MNRLQNTNNVLLANADTGDVRQMFRDQDETWVEVNNNFVAGRRQAPAVRPASATAGGTLRHFARGRRPPRSPPRRSTWSRSPAVDEPGGWLYYIASPENATQRYLYRSRLDGSGTTERVTPATAPGTHTYNIVSRLPLGVP